MFNQIGLDSAPAHAFVLAYFTDGVELGTYQGGRFSFEGQTDHAAENLLELHVFDQEAEFRWVLGMEKGVLLTDDQHEDSLDENQFLFGEGELQAGQCTDGKTVLTDRGVTKTIYLPLAPHPRNEPPFLRVRNYLRYDEETGMIETAGYRLVGIFNHAGKEVLRDAH